jgi:hypothetical protein
VRTRGEMADLTPEALESQDLVSGLSPLEKVEVCGELYALAPGADSLEKRRWISERLGLPLWQVSHVLWKVHGIKWPKIVAQEPGRRRRKPRRAAPEAKPPPSVEDITRLLADLQIDISDDF